LPESDLALLTEAALAAGEIASDYWGKGPRIWDKGDGAGPVTEADFAVDEMLRDRLLGARPDYGWLSEETEDGPERLERDRVFIVDPIDGTRAFIAGERTWAHSIAVAEAGRIIAASVYLPLKNRHYTAEIGKGAALNGKPIQNSDCADVAGARVLTSRPTLTTEFWPHGVPPVDRHFRPSLAYRLALVAEGRFDAMITFRDTWEWDVAAGALIVAEAGGTVTDQRGGNARFNNKRPMLDGLIAAAPVLHSAFGRLLTRD